MAPRRLAYLLLVAILLSPKAFAQPGDRPLDLKGQVLDLLFPTDDAPKPYFLKMVLRFGDNDSQLVIVVYPGSKVQMIRYRLNDTSRTDLRTFVSKSVADSSTIKPRDIAGKLKVDVTRLPVDYADVSRAIDELNSIRISPALPHGVSVDNFSEYEFWYDTWQESVHYVIVSPFQREAKDELGKWMLKVRANADEWVKRGAGRSRSENR